MGAVLIVDDEYGLAEMASELLTVVGFTVATAVNGRLALATLGQMRPDLILLDVMMPIMSGPDTLRMLKDDESLRDIPVIMMSAAGREALPEDITPLVAGFLQKPFTFDELLVAVREHVR
ncbi:MAG TPA: response regulator [Kofleriaceae bacterium]